MRCNRGPACSEATRPSTVTASAAPDEPPAPRTQAVESEEAERDRSEPQDHATEADGVAFLDQSPDELADAERLHDLGGNVWEWCEDWWSGEETDHVLRGGSWMDEDKRALLSSARQRTHPFNAGHLRGRGFRVVLERSND